MHKARDLLVRPETECVEHGAAVITMSLGGIPSFSLHRAVRRAVAAPGPTTSRHEREQWDFSDKQATERNAAKEAHQRAQAAVSSAMSEAKEMA